GIGFGCGSGGCRGTARATESRCICAAGTAGRRREGASTKNVRYELSFNRGGDQPADERSRLECNGTEYGGSGSEGIGRGGEGDRGLFDEDPGPLSSRI